MVETVPPLLGAGARFVAAGAIFAGWLALTKGLGALVLRPAELGAAALMGALLPFGGNGLVTVAEQRAPSGLSALIIASVPLWVVVFRLLVRERVAAVTLVGVAVGFVGVALLVVPGDRPGGAPLWSLLVLIAAAASWSAGSVLSSRLPLPRDVFVATAAEMVLGGAMMLVAGLAAGEAGEVDPARFSGRSLVALAYLVLAGSLLAFTAYVWLLHNAPVSLASTYAFVNPVVAIFLGWAILDEELTWFIAAGAAVVVAAVAFVVRKEAETEPPSP